MAGGFQSDIPPAVNQTAKKYIRGMMKGRHRWNKLYGSRSKEVMHKTANKMAMGEMQKMPPTYNEIFGEANKSGDSSLRDWFGKSRSSDGTPGWVQLGGKYAGKPCAKQPGQTTKPKCGSSKMKRDLNKDEEERAFRRKNRQDPNPDRRGKAKNVATEETILERGDYWHPDPDKDRKLGGPGANQRAREDRADAAKPKKNYSKTTKPGESYMDYAKRKQAEKSSSSKPKYSPEIQKRLDAAKAKKKGGILSRIARKVGLKNGYELEGNFVQEARNPYAVGMAQAMKTTGDTPPLEKSTIKKAHKIAKAIKKEEIELEEGRATDIAIKAIRATQGEKPKELSKRTEMIRRLKQRQLDKYLKQRDKKKSERVTNVGMGEELEWLTEEQFDEAAGEKDACYKKVKSRYKVWPSAYASGALVKCRKVGAANWGNKSEEVSFQEFQEKCWKGYKQVGMKKKGAKMVPNCVPEEVQNEGAAWTKKAGQNSEGGLNEKGRKSYERENPGSDLKRPSKKVGNKRRASFCARMRGMRKRQKPSNNTGDDRLSKSLRAWNC